VLGSRVRGLGFGVWGCTIAGDRSSTQNRAHTPPVGARGVQCKQAIALHCTRCAVQASNRICSFAIAFVSVQASNRICSFGVQCKQAHLFTTPCLPSRRCMCVVRVRGCAAVCACKPSGWDPLARMTAPGMACACVCGFAGERFRPMSLPCTLLSRPLAFRAVADDANVLCQQQRGTRG
jgi:hypothetical protein